MNRNAGFLTYSNVRHIFKLLIVNLIAGIQNMSSMQVNYVMHLATLNIIYYEYSS